MRLVLIPLCLGLLSSCKPESKSEPAKAPTEPQNAESAQDSPSESEPSESEPSKNTTPLSAADREAMNTTTKGLNAFTIQLYKETPKKGNALLSPFSAAAALSLVELGARGDAAAALHKVLGATTAAQHRSGLKSLMQTLLSDGKPVQKHGQDIFPHALRIGNSLWVAKDYQLKKEFVETAKSHYQASAHSIDVSDPEGSADQINTWVLKATADKIKDLVSPNAINAMTRMILVNAVHFLGRWREPFQVGSTKDLPFHVDGLKQTVAVPTMLNSYFYNSFVDKEVSVVELPYWGGETEEMVMTLIVPKKRDGLEALEAKLSMKLLESWFAGMHSSPRVAIYLPKWKSESEVELTETLVKAGLKPLFGAGADLSGISSEENLQLSAVLQKTFISVDEKGTEAAAATAIMMAGAMPQEPIDVHVDRPFLYLIRERNTGAILFIGRVLDPR